MPKHSEWAMCLGGAESIWEDVAAWEEIYGKQWDGIVITANDIFCHWPREVHALVSMHQYSFPAWKALRIKHQLPPFTGQTWTRRYRMGGPGGADRELDPWAGGSSGMFTLQVAQSLGCTKAVLCGIPLTQTPHFAETHENFHAQWLAANAHYKAWVTCKDKMDGWVKSMSGRTQELLGAPTLEWLQGE